MEKLNLWVLEVQNEMNFQSKEVYMTSVAGSYIMLTEKLFFFFLNGSEGFFISKVKTIICYFVVHLTFKGHFRNKNRRTLRFCKFEHVLLPKYCRFKGKKKTKNILLVVFSVLKMNYQNLHYKCSLFFNSLSLG